MRRDVARLVRSVVLAWCSARVSFAPAPEDAEIEEGGITAVAPAHPEAAIAYVGHGERAESLASQVDPLGRVLWCRRAVAVVLHVVRVAVAFAICSLGAVRDSARPLVG